MPNFKSHQVALDKLREAQDADHDNRRKARDAHLFVNARNGQWEPLFWENSTGRPRYTFDMTSPVIDQIAGEMDQSDFVINVDPIGGESTKDLASTAGGLIRNIENISNAKHIYNAAGRGMITSGLSGWRVNTKFVTEDSFDVDLTIETIPNFIDRVWFDTGSEQQSRGDAKYCYVLQAMSKDDYEDRFPKGSGQSVAEDRQANAFFEKGEKVIVGEILYKKKVTREIVLLTNGQVLEVNDDYEAIRDEFEAIGITEKRRRKKKTDKVFSRMFDGSDWLEKEKKTVFNLLPVIPTYANFSVFENKILYYGVVEKLLDWQRVLNYGKSREIEEIALAPRAKWWMTNKQMQGFEDTLATLNTNADPVQGFNVDPDNPGPPQQNGGAVVNPGLVTMSQSMQEGIARTAGLFAASMGEQVNNQSGVAIKALQNKGNIGTIKYFKAQEIAICQTGKILLDAIPRVYDTERQVRVLGEDGQASTITLNEQVIDQQTGDVIELNDLSQGKYDLTCSSGASFQSKMDESVAAIIEMSHVDPSIIQEGGDILFNNISAPGMDLLAERKRQTLFQNGLIPQSQLTQEEQQILQQQQEAAAQEPEQPDPNTMIAQAELLKAQVQQQEAEIATQEKGATIQLKQQEQERKDAETQARIQNQELQAQINVQKAETEAQNAQNAQIMAVIKQEAQERAAINQELMDGLNAIKTQAETLKIIREAMGIDSIIGPHNQAAYINQATELNESITEDDPTPTAKINNEGESLTL